jgi:hypothetical protein
VSLIAQLITQYFISFEINIVSASLEILNKLSCESRNERECDIFSEENNDVGVCSEACP